ncbi:MAG: signal peptide peptidase SppA [Thermodesulfobacteriota bacterium]
MKKYGWAGIIAVAFSLMVLGCVSPQVKLFSDASDPLQQYRLSGREEGKVLVVPVHGVISDSPKEEVLRTRPSPVQEVVSQLDMARRDPEIRAVLLKINSPGGSVTASDVIYNEIKAFKEETGARVVVSMMNVAASGGYYVALPADHIMAHPTTVTGSVGVIFMRPNIDGLMDKLGVEVAVNRSGKNKDMGSPFRKSTEQEKALFENVIDSLGGRFVQLVEKHRGLSPEALETIATARIFLADQALEKGLIDEIGYLPDAIDKAKSLAGLPDNSKVVVYRRSEFPNDNIYNPVQMQHSGNPSLIDLGLPSGFMRHLAGFYYLWTPGLENN